jgi:hypothetical protein
VGSASASASKELSLAPARAVHARPGVPGVGHCGHVPSEAELERVLERLALGAWRDDGLQGELVVARDAVTVRLFAELGAQTNRAPVHDVVRRVVHLLVVLVKRAKLPVLGEEMRVLLWFRALAHVSFPPSSVGSWSGK